MVPWLNTEMLGVRFSISLSLSLCQTHTPTHTLNTVAKPSQQALEVIIRALWVYLLCRAEPSAFC